MKWKVDGKSLSDLLELYTRSLLYQTMWKRLSVAMKYWEDCPLPSEKWLNRGSCSAITGTGTTRRCWHFWQVCYFCKLHPGWTRCMSWAAPWCNNLRWRGLLKFVPILHIACFSFLCSSYNCLFSYLPPLLFSSFKRAFLRVGDRSSWMKWYRIWRCKRHAVLQWPSQKWFLGTTVSSFRPCM